MAKKMKHERKAARLARSQDAPSSVDAVIEIAPTPEPVKAVEVEPLPKAAPKPMKVQSPLEQIASYVRAFDFGRLRSVATKAVQSGALTDEQVDRTIDAALPTIDQIEKMPLNKVLAAASIASDKKREEYRPILVWHAKHAQSLPENEAGQVRSHLALLGFLEQEMA